MMAYKPVFRAFKYHQRFLGTWFFSGWVFSYGSKVWILTRSNLLSKKIFLLWFIKFGYFGMVFSID